MSRSPLIVTLLLAISLTHAQNVPEHTRVVYSGPELPDGLAFLSTMTILASMNDVDNGSPAVDLVQRGMGLSPAEARTVLDELLAAYQEFGNDRRSYTTQVLCPSDRARPAGDAIYQALEAIDDAEEWLAAKHLQAVKIELGGDKGTRLQQWLQSEKYGSTYAKPDYKAHYEQAGRSAEGARDRVCNAVVDKMR